MQVLSGNRTTWEYNPSVSFADSSHAPTALRLRAAVGSAALESEGFWRAGRGSLGVATAVLHKGAEMRRGEGTPPYGDAGAVGKPHSMGIQSLSQLR